MNKGILFFLLVLATFSSWGQSGPAGVGMADGSSALKLWLDADNGVYTDTNRSQPAKLGDRVMVWKDLSGNGNDVKAQSDSTRPTFAANNPLLNGSSGLLFTKNAGSKNKRNSLSSKSFPKTNDITIYCVFHALSKAGGTNITPYFSKTYDLNMWYYGAGLVDAGDPIITNDISLAFCDTSIAAGAGDSTTRFDYCIKTPASTHKTYFAALQKEAWTGSLSIAHNNNLRTFMKAGPQPINNSTKYFIGSNSNTDAPSESPFFDGYIAQVLVYNRLLNSAEKIILENYLAAKYNMPLYAHDLYKFDETEAGNYDHEVVGIGKAQDGSFQLSAKGEGGIELTNPNELERGDYLFIGHNGKPTELLMEDVPEGIQAKLERQWVCSKIGKTQKIDLLMDASVLNIGKDDLMLLIDTDNNGSFSDEKLGEGMIPVTEVTAHGRSAFRGVDIKHGNRFTFGQLAPACHTGCDAYFTPNGDGLSDAYFMEQAGKTTIYDRSGKLIKSLPTPSYWDGTNEKGELAVPGIYFLIANEDTQKTVTLIR